MANNAQFPGMQFPPVVPVPVVPAPQSQPYNPVSSQQFQQVGRTNIGLSSHSQHFQFSQPVQQLPARPGLQPPQAIMIPEVQANRPSIPVSPQPPQNAQIPNNYVPGLSGPRMPLSSSYTFSTSSGGQPQRNADALSQYQPISQTNVSNFAVGGQPWLLTGSQTTTSVVSVQQIGEQSSATATVVPAAIVEPSLNEKLPSDWLEHTSGAGKKYAGKKYYFNKKTKLSTWEKPSELMTPIERADASTDWREYRSPEGRKYYYNKITKQSKWKIPDELKLAREQMKMASSKETQAGKDNSPVPAAAVHSMVKSPPPNAVTSSSSDHGVVSSPIQVATVSTVVNPQPVSTSEQLPLPVVPSTVTTNVIEVQTPVETITPITAVSGGAESFSTSVTTVMAQMSNDNNNAAQDVVNTVDGVSPGVAEEAEKGKGSAGKVNVTASGEKTVVQEPLVYENKLEARNAFKALLESANVGSDWTWDQAMRVTINDQRYGALRTLGERKQAFSEFLIQRKKQDAEERRARQKKAQEEFRTMLEECKELTSTTRWSKAIAIIEDDERFKAVERAKDREDVFEDYIVELEKKERAKALEEHKRNRMEYLNFLKSCDFITASSQWRKVQDRLEDDERCSRLEKIDRLEIFQEHLRDLEREEEEQMKLRMEELRKAERKNRDEFRKLMEGHVAAGILTAETHWRDYCTKVKDLPAYLAVSSNASGSTAKDLFEDVAEELQKQRTSFLDMEEMDKIFDQIFQTRQKLLIYLDDKARIKDAMKFRKIALSSTWTLEDFKSAINEHISSPQLADINLKLVFDELLERVKEKEEKEAKRRKRLADDFYDLLCNSKDVTASSKWEDCKQLVEDRQESWFNVEESFFREIFEKYITELKEKAKEKERKRRDDKAKRDRDAKDREKKKEKQIREKGRGFESKNGKDGTHSDNAEKIESYGLEENRRSGKDKDKKHRKRHRHSVDDLSVDENEKDRSKDSHRHSSDWKKSKQMEQRSTSELDSESRHKRHKKDHRDGSHRNADYEEVKNRQFGEDGEVW